MDEGFFSGVVWLLWLVSKSATSIWEALSRGWSSLAFPLLLLSFLLSFAFGI